MAYQSDHFLYKSLDAEQEAIFRAWARENHKPGDKVDEVWHPVIRDECEKIDKESA